MAHGGYGEGAGRGGGSSGPLVEGVGEARVRVSRNVQRVRIQQPEAGRWPLAASSQQDGRWQPAVSSQKDNNWEGDGNCNGDGDGNEDGRHGNEDGVESSSTLFVLQARWRIL